MKKNLRNILNERINALQDYLKKMEPVNSKNFKTYNCVKSTLEINKNLYNGLFEKTEV